MRAHRAMRAAILAPFAAAIGLAALHPSPAEAATTWTCAHNGEGAWDYPGPERPLLRRYLLDGETFVSLDGIEVVEGLSQRDVELDDDIVAVARWKLVEDSGRKLVAVQYLDDESAEHATFSALIVDKVSGLMRLIEARDADAAPAAYFGSCSEQRTLPPGNGADRDR